MGDLVLKRLQVGTEGPFTSGSAYQPAGSVSVYGSGGAAVAASRRVAVDDSTEFGYAELTYESPEETRGTYAAYYTHLLQMRMAKGKFGSLLYPDDMTWWLRGVVSGNPTVTTLPSTPDVVLPSAAVSATTVPLTGITQPNALTDGAKAKILALVLTNATTNNTAVQLTIQGTDVNGASLTEIVDFSAGVQTPSKVGGGAGATTCTLYTTNYFATITSITASSATTGDSLEIDGVNGFLWSFTPDMGTSSIVSLTGEYFDGSTAWQLPGMIVQKFDFDIQLGKTAAVKADAVAKDMTYLASGMTTLSDQVLPAISAYQARYYSDPIGVVPGTTQVSARLIQAAVSIDNQVTLGKAADGTPNPTFAARKRYKTSADLTLLFQSGVTGSEDPADFAAFSTSYAARTIMLAMPAVDYLPCGALTSTLALSGWPSQLGDATGKPGLYGMTIAHAGKFTAGTPQNVDGRLAVKLKHDMQVDLTSMQAAYQIQLVNRMNPNMV